MIKIGIIGLGHWGPNYLRIFNSLSEVEVSWCCDLVDENLNKVKYLPNVRLTKDYKEILSDASVNVVIVATPANVHHRIIKDCLNHGKDVLAEKPLTLIPEESIELVQLAHKNNRILMVGHTFIYNPGIRKIREFIDKGELGNMYYLNATRTHLGLIREDVNAIWDLAPHDISIFNYLLGTTPIMVSAIGACHLKKDREDIAFINLLYPNNVIANIHVSWEDSNKERTIRVVGSKARVVFNDLDNLEKIKLYQKGISVSEDYNDFGEFQLRLRDGDIISPRVETKEPLKEQCLHFIDCVINRKQPLTDGNNGMEVVKAMYAIERSLKNNGAVVYVDKISERGKQ